MAVYYGNASLPHLHSWTLLEEWLVPVCSPEYAAAVMVCSAQIKPISGANVLCLHCTESLEQYEFGYEWQHWSQSTGVVLPHSNRKYVLISMRWH